MVRVVGIDPGTKSFDIFGLDDDKVIVDEVIDSKLVVQNPRIILGLLKNLGNLDLVLGPSGYGLPLKKISELNETDYFFLTLKKKGEEDVIGMTNVINSLKELDCDVIFCPSLIHLPTIPKYRKINKIDIGTSDKLCSTALAIYEQAKRLNINYSETSFILVEMGYSFNSVIGVDNGMIVDGIGGSSGNIGFRAIGFMDSELAYLLSPMKKRLLLQGGLCSVAKVKNIKDFLKLFHEDDENALIAWKAFHEGIEKSVLSMLNSISNPKEIILSGRLVRIKEFYDEVKSRLSKYARVVRIKGIGKYAKESAQGAALIANGLAKGKYSKLVDTMKIKDSFGTCLDYITYDEIRCLLKREEIEESSS